MLRKQDKAAPKTLPKKIVGTRSFSVCEISSLPPFKHDRITTQIYCIITTLIIGKQGVLELFRLALHGKIVFYFHHEFVAYL